MNEETLDEMLFRLTQECVKEQKRINATSGGTEQFKCRSIGGLVCRRKEKGIMAVLSFHCQNYKKGALNGIDGHNHRHSAEP